MVGKTKTEVKFRDAKKAPHESMSNQAADRLVTKKQLLVNATEVLLTIHDCPPDLPPQPPTRIDDGFPYCTGPLRQS
jgi:hypothetical protein